MDGSWEYMITKIYQIGKVKKQKQKCNFAHIWNIKLKTTNE